MTDKIRYSELCKREPSIPIFSRDWWMDAVCGESSWDVILISKGNEVSAALPYYFTMREGKKVIVQPPLTQKNGIWIKYPANQKYFKRLGFEKEIMNAVIDEIANLNLLSYNQNYSYEITNWLPFYWRSFSQFTRYTYVIENLNNLDNVFDGIDPKTRNQIRKAEKLLTVKEDLSVEEFYKINTMTFSRQDMKIPYTLYLVKRIYEGCSKNSCVKIFSAEDSEGNLHGAVFIVWDENSAYYLLGGTNPEFKNSDANSLLIWKAIQFASTVTKKFDFEGSMIEPIERFFRSFGAVQKPYFNISRQFQRESLMKIIAKDIYNNSPLLKKSYNKLRGK